MPENTPPADDTTGRTLADIGEDRLLQMIFPLMPVPEGVELGPGDDAAVLAAPGRTVLTTDTMVLGQDWLPQWSSPQDVGAKCVAQNLADVAAMGATPTGLLVTLVAAPSTPLDWAVGFAEGIGQAAAEAGTGVLGGDLSSAGEGVAAVSIVAVGDLGDRAPVTRSGARPGDVVAVAGSLGRAAAGLHLFLTDQWQDATPEARELLDAQRRPTPPLACGPQAADAGASAMIDLSDGLVRDAGRVARASDVVIALDSAALATDLDALRPHVGDEAALDSVLGGGEEHSLLACFPPYVPLPPPWRIIGQVEPASRPGGTPSDAQGDQTHRVLVDGTPPHSLGWDHFGG